ncbi:serine/threonine-protein kinase [Corynebacterium lubricantis]|uniref:serine/threonine-protein kinase n=1 Tax=Corynebacterium lubricantis TaxID=541095 RepID=UPI0003651E07|nr:serine/threonine-protein kinase [Corynebacterium lubricantis]
MHPDNLEGLQELIGSDYTLQWIIGHGGMSTVWLADDNTHDREVAIKVLKPEFSSHEEFLTRFRNEATAAEGIESENVVATYDYREVESDAGFTVCFIVMEYVRGESLADLLAREGKMDEPLALDVLEQAAHGLKVIHSMGLVHRDIKPGNIMITQNGQVKITDFGIAKAAAAVPLTRTGMVVGTAQYVSPEQAQGKEVTAASDVYSLGVVGYELLAGQRPFSGDSSVSVALAHVNNVPPALSTSVSAPARELIEIALRKNPETRFADGNEFAIAVAAVREGKRPPQPASAAMNQVAEEPSPTASTRQLAAVAQPTTLHPAARKDPEGLVTGPAQKAPKAAPQQAQTKKNSSWPWVLLILLLIAAIGGLVWAFVSDSFSSRNNEPPTPTEVIVTETVTSSNGEPTSVEEPTFAPAPTTQAPTQAPETTRTTSQQPTTREPEPTQTTQAPTQEPEPTQPTQVPPTSDTGNGNNNGNGAGPGEQPPQATQNGNGPGATGGTGNGTTGGGAATPNDAGDALVDMLDGGA